MGTTPVRRRSRRTLLASLIAVVALAGALGTIVWVRGTKAKNAAGKKHAAVQAPSAAPVAISPVHTGSLATYLEATSNLEPHNAATLVAQRPGQIVGLFVGEGASVRSG